MDNLESKLNLCDKKISKEEIERASLIGKKNSELQSNAAILGFLSNMLALETIVMVTHQLENFRSHFNAFMASNAVGIFFGLLMRFSDNHRTGDMSKNLKAIYHDKRQSFSKDPKIKAYHQLEVAKLTADPLIKHRTHAHICLNNQDYEQALEEYLLMLQTRKSSRIPTSIVEDLLILPVEGFQLRHNARKSSSLTNFMELAAYYAIKGKFEKVKDTLVEALSKKENQQIAPSLLIAEFLDNSGYPEEASRIFRTTLEDILKDPSLNLSPFGKSNHEVLTDRYSFVVKRDDKEESLKKEYDLLGLINSALKEYAKLHSLDEDFIKIADALTFTKLDGKYHLITKRRRADNLETAFEKSPESVRETILKNTLKSLAGISSIVTPKAYNSDLVKEHDYIREVGNRLLSRLGDNDYFVKFLQEYTRFTDRIKELTGTKDLNVLGHGDAYLSNFLVDGTVLDVEKAVLVDPTRDPAILLDHPLILYEDSYFDHYFDALQYYSYRPFNRLTLDNLFMMNRICNSICQIGSKINQGKNDQASFYFNRALLLLRQIGDRSLETAFKDYIGLSEKLAKVA